MRPIGCSTAVDELQPLGDAYHTQQLEPQLRPRRDNIGGVCRIHLAGGQLVILRHITVHCHDDVAAMVHLYFHGVSRLMLAWLHCDVTKTNKGSMD
jgi:hypothetical protein